MRTPTTKNKKIIYFNYHFLLCILRVKDALLICRRFRLNKEET
jgi:hypothetical protein